MTTTGFVDPGHCRKSAQPNRSHNLDPKPAGKPIAGNRHDGFEEAGAGNRLMGRYPRARRQSSTRPGGKARHFAEPNQNAAFVPAQLRVTWLARGAISKNASSS